MNEMKFYEWADVDQYIDELKAERVALREVKRLAIALCNSANETEQNGYRRQLGILLCGWPES